MIATGIIVLSTGLLSLAMGIYLKSGKAEVHGKKHKKSGARPPDPKGFLIGGVIITLAGVACLVAAATQ